MWSRVFSSYVATMAVAALGVYLLVRSEWFSRPLPALAFGALAVVSLRLNEVVGDGLQLLLVFGTTGSFTFAMGLVRPVRGRTRVLPDGPGRGRSGRGIGQPALPAFFAALHATGSVHPRGHALRRGRRCVVAVGVAGLSDRAFRPTPGRGGLVGDIGGAGLAGAKTRQGVRPGRRVFSSCRCASHRWSAKRISTMCWPCCPARRC